jgi:hypothetical protein
MAAQRVIFVKAKLDDKPGTLLAVMQDLKARNISLRAIWGYAVQGGYSEICAVPRDMEKLRNTWKSAGILIEEETAIFLKGTDKTGVLLKSLEALAAANVNMKTINALAIGGKYGSIVRIDPADIGKAAQALGVK